MKEYLRMSDVFGVVGVKVREGNGRHVMCEDILAANCFCEDSAEYAAHAINSHDELVARVNELESFLHHFVDNSYNVDAGGADFTATTCEALEMAEKLDNRAYDGMWHGH